MSTADQQAPRPLLAAEQTTPEPLHTFLRDLEICNSSEAVWKRLVTLSRGLELPAVDYIVACAASSWKRTLFIRTSHDSRWLQEANQDPEVTRWSYFRSHAMDHLTPLMIGLEFVDDNVHMPEARVAVLREAARRGMRAGFSVPLRTHAPPMKGIISFLGDHSRRDMLAITRAHGWTLNVAALTAHQRYIALWSAEFFDRNDISEKQREMLELLGLGYQDKVIADRLDISVSALRQRMQVLMTKAGVHNRAELAALAMSAGLLPDPQRALDPESLNVSVQIDGVETDPQPSHPHAGESGID